MLRGRPETEPRPPGSAAIDLRVEYMKEADFQKRLADQRARWEQKGRKLELLYDDFIPLRPIIGESAAMRVS